MSTTSSLGQPPRTRNRIQQVALIDSERGEMSAILNNNNNNMPRADNATNRHSRSHSTTTATFAITHAPEIQESFIINGLMADHLEHSYERDSRWKPNLSWSFFSWNNHLTGHEIDWRNRMQIKLTRTCPPNVRQSASLARQQHQQPKGQQMANVGRTRCVRTSTLIACPLTVRAARSNRAI